jgi:hypothetical protein
MLDGNSEISAGERKETPGNAVSSKETSWHRSTFPPGSNGGPKVTANQTTNKSYRVNNSVIHKN